MIFSQFHFDQKHLQILSTPLNLHISVNSIKLERDLQSTLEPLNHFYSQISTFKKINYIKKSNLFIYLYYDLISIYDPRLPKIWWVKKPMVRNISSCFFHHLISSYKTNNSMLTSSFTSSLVFVIF